MCHFEFDLNKECLDEWIVPVGSAAGRFQGHVSPCCTFATVKEFPKVDVDDSFSVVVAAGKVNVLELTPASAAKGEPNEDLAPQTER